jgi:hypothetical protein
MTKSVEKEYPDCGLYITGSGLPGHEEHLGEGLMVYFHNHSPDGPPIVLLPNENANNRWSFQENGHLVQDDSFIGALKPIPPEGFYRLRQHLHVDEEKVLPEQALVQLGYSRTGEPILFVPTLDGSSLNFPGTGFRWKNPRVVFESIAQETLRVLDLPAPEASMMH